MRRIRHPGRKSARGYKSLGKAGDVTKAQHCRAEFYAQGMGWFPVDPQTSERSFWRRSRDSP